MSHLYLGETDDRQRPTDEPGATTTAYALTARQRAIGMHVIGAPDSGKSKFLEHCIRKDILAGRGVCVIDPHGALYNNVLRFCAYARPNRVIIPLNFSKGQHVIGFNPWPAPASHESAHDLVQRGLTDIVKAWNIRNTDETPTLEKVLRLVLHAIIEGGLTIAEAAHLLPFHNSTVRNYLVSRIRTRVIAEQWRDLTAAKWTEWQNELHSTNSKLLRFLAAEPVLRFLSLTENSINLRTMMDEGAVLLVNLKPQRGVFDEMDGRLIGRLLVSQFFSAARDREPADNEPDPRPFYLYCDEFQNYISPDVAEIVPQGRKFGLALILAHQFCGQLEREDPHLVEAVLNAVRTRVVFGGCSYKDAAAMVPSLFAGQIDYHEVKRIDYSVKFWPEYDRDQTITEGASRTAGHGGGESDVNIANWGNSTGMQWTPDGEMGATFEGANFGGSHAHTEQSTWMQADANNRSVANVPIYRPVPYLEADETPWSLEEQKERLAHALMLSQQRHGFVRAHEDFARPLRVPFVNPYLLPADSVSAYEAETADLAGAVTPSAAQAILDDRRQQIESAAVVDLEMRPSGNRLLPQSAPVSLPYDRTPRKIAAKRRIRPNPDLKPGTRKIKPSQGANGSEG